VRASKGEKKSQRGGGQDKTREQVREKQANGTAESERASEIQKERDNAEHPSSQLVMLFVCVARNSHCVLCAFACVCVSVCVCVCAL